MSIPDVNKKHKRTYKVYLLLKDAIFSKESIITLAVKVARLILSVIALKLVEMMFKNYYIELDSELENTELPRLTTFVWAFFIFDFLLNILISLSLLAFLDPDISKASLIDFVIGFTISLKLSMTSAQILNKSLDYQYNGLKTISDLQKLIMSIISLNLFVPYYLMVRHIIY
jgi:hypothetical protein